MQQNGTQSVSRRTKGTVSKFLPKEQESTSAAMQRRVSNVIFISLLIDLLAFTMILPLLPSLLEYYRQNEKVAI